MSLCPSVWRQGVLERLSYPRQFASALFCPPDCCQLLSAPPDCELVSMGCCTGKPNRLWHCGGSWDSEEHRDIPQSPWSSGGARSQVSSRSVTQSQRQRGSLGLSLCSVVGQIVGPYHLPPNSSCSQPDRGERARQDAAVR